MMTLQRGRVLLQNPPSQVPCMVQNLTHMLGDSIIIEIDANELGAIAECR